MIVHVCSMEKHTHFLWFRECMTVPAYCVFVDIFVCVTGCRHLHLSVCDGGGGVCVAVCVRVCV